MIRSIEGLRGVAALLVAFYHVYVFGNWGGLPARWGVLQNAWLFVDLFFVISGFVMAAAYGERLRTPVAMAGYMIRRFFRLYPLHIVTTVGTILAALAVQSAKWLLANEGIAVGSEKPFSVPVFDLNYFGLELLMLQGVGIMVVKLHNYPAWSISVEFWLYLVFGLSMVLVQGRRARIALSAAIVALCVAHFALLWAGAAPAQVTLDVHGLPRGLLSFFQGVLIFYGWQAWRGAMPAPHGVMPAAAALTGPPGQSAWLLGGVQLAAAALALYLVARQSELGTAQLAIPFAFGLLVLTVLPDSGLLAKLLQTRPMQWLGLHSYAIYLTHASVQTVLDWPGRVVPEPAKHLVGLLFLVLVLVLSALCHRFVEVPWRDRGKRIAARIETGAIGSGDLERAATRMRVDGPAVEPETVK